MKNMETNIGMVWKKKAVFGVILFGMASQMSACTDTEVANAVGTAAIIGGAVIIANNTKCEGGYKNECHYYRDYNGNAYSECRDYYDDCAYLVPKKATASVAGVTIAGFSEAAVDEVRWGKEFILSYDSSKQFIDAMKQARNGNLQVLLSMGLTRDDVSALVQGNEITDAGKQSLAKALNSDPWAVGMMVQQIFTTSREKVVEAQAAQRAKLIRDSDTDY